MPRHPVAGFPTMTAAVLELRAQRFSDAAIAKRIGRDVKTVRALAWHAGHSKRPETDREPTATVRVRKRTIDKLRPSAAARGIEVNVLIRRILDTAARESLVDAVLDDRDDAGEAAQ